MITAAPIRDALEVDRLVQAEIRLPEQVARKFLSPAHSQFDDLVSHGMQGLWEAAQCWPDDGDPFHSFARRRIRWRMQNCLARSPKVATVQVERLDCADQPPLDIPTEGEYSRLDALLENLPYKMHPDFLAACRLYGVNARQVPAEELAREMGVTREWVYKQIKVVTSYLRRHHADLLSG